jgi:hypothetical protein
LNGAANFLIPADHRAKLAVPGRLGQVRGIFLQGIVAFSAVALSARAALAQIINGAVQILRCQTGLLQGRRGGR